MEKFPTLTNDLLKEMQWLHSHQEETSGIKQQKFLLFYNLFAFTHKKSYNFNSLKAWTNGPVYTQVHSAVKHHYTYQELFQHCQEGDNVNEEIAHVTKFIIELLTDEEISEVTHQFDFWKNVIEREENTIDVKDISTDDIKKIDKIFKQYTLEFIVSHKIIVTDKAKIIVHIDDYEFIKNKMYNKLSEIESKKPVKIELDTDLLKIKKEYDLYGAINLLENI